MAKNVILLGGSNSVMVNGLQKGLREGIEKYNARLESLNSNTSLKANLNENSNSQASESLNPQQKEKLKSTSTSNSSEKLEFHNLALGATSCIQSLYELVRYKDLIKNAELIIAESNINDVQEYYALKDEAIITRNLFLFYDYLSQFDKKVLILILPYERGDKKIIKQINLIHQFYVDKYGFNLINIYEFYEQNHLFDLLKFDFYHQVITLMKFYGKKIIENLSSFQNPKKSSDNSITTSNQFEICTPKNMHQSTQIEQIHAQNSVYNETIFRLKGEQTLTFDEKFKDYKILLIHVWNLSDLPWSWPECCGISSDLVIKNAHSILIKTFSYRNQIQICLKLFVIDENTSVSFNFKHLTPTEQSYGAAHTRQDLDYIDLIGFLLVKNLKFTSKLFDDFTPVTIQSKYDFNFLIHEVLDIKEIIDEWGNHIKQENLAICKELEQKDKENLNLKAENERLKIFENELKTLPLLKQRQELVNLKIDESVKKIQVKEMEQNLNIKKLEVKKLEKELGMKLSKLEPRMVLNLNENLRNSAVARVRNHLAYRLGAAIIVCNKSLWGLVSLPFVLSFIKAQYKKEQAAYQSLIKQKPEFKLPKIENYSDYKAALKEKECLTYKLGEAMMRADKTWYKFGYVKFYVEAKRLEREFKERK